MGVDLIYKTAEGLVAYSTFRSAGLAFLALADAPLDDAARIALASLMGTPSFLEMEALTFLNPFGLLIGSPTE